MKVALHILAALNIIDAIVTAIGIENAYIQEANPLMDLLYTTHPVFFIALKILLSLMVYTLIFFDKIPSKKWFSSITYTAVTLYSLIFLLHGTWVYNVLAK
ncbi:hypothetical protein FZC79_10820 [Rossellomorea vietnamensis]|uniref:DUF5658 domain-containing protein n=1 Tax=Rossellomorea vietnamensis TaxID=218284 RepID=A0A5D4KEE2_9BACI|nr:DUF5658 family protein [Rossellomorea vietnamensis]TYR75249.1 hypothetical protein FZC79_10820 [Rossellomorea vietnamensis]